MAKKKKTTKTEKDELAKLKTLLESKEKELSNANAKLSEFEKKEEPDLTRYVPKDKLKKETAVERVQWWFNDLEGTKKIIAHVLAFLVILIMSAGVYFGAIQMETLVALGEELGGVFSTTVTIITFLMGAIGQYSALRKPAEKKNS